MPPGMARASEAGGGRRSPQLDGGARWQPWKITELFNSVMFLGIPVAAPAASSMPLSRLSPGMNQLTWGRMKGRFQRTELLHCAR